MKPTQKNDVTTVLVSLADKSTELRSLSNQEMIDLCQKLLSCLYNRESEWSEADSWRFKEAQLLGLISSKANDKDDAEKVPINDAAQFAMTSAKHYLCAIMAPFIQTVITSLEYSNAEGDDSKNDKIHEPELLKSVKTITTSDENYSVYGPVPVPMNLPGHKFEVWTKKEPKASTVVDGSKKDNGNPKKQVTLVLGAGNQSVLTIIDTLQRCLIDRETVLIKHHPLRPWLLAPYDILLQALILRGFVSQVLDHGIPDTTQIISNELIGHVHLTGSFATETSVIKTLSETRPNLPPSEIRNMVTSELGCATPYIIHPGEYSEKELIHVARMISHGKKMNGGCNCIGSQVICLPAEWDQKDEFRKILIEELDRQPTFPSYYPGSKQRRNTVIQKYETCTITVTKALYAGIIENPDDQVAIIECGTPGEADYDGTALTTEAFGSFLAIIELPRVGTKDANNGGFVESTVAPFLNDKSNIYGSLSCSLMVPSTIDSASVENAVSSLKYGTVAVNTFSGLGYFTLTSGGIWGAHPDDSSGQSGYGFMGNQYELNVDKVVLYGPPLTTKPVFDLASPPPIIVLEAVHTLTCAPSTMIGMIRLSKLLTSRAVGCILSYTLFQIFPWSRKLLGY